MIAMVMLGVLAAAQPMQQERDTSFAVERGTSLSVHNDRGSVFVEVWRQDRISVSIDRDRDRNGGYSVRNRGSLVELRTTSRRGPAELEMRVTVPEWMAVEVEGDFADVTINGTRADIGVHTTHGDVSVRGGQGFIELYAVNGDITLEDGSGRARLETMNGDIYVTNMTGEINVVTINGEVDLLRMDAAAADVSTVNGDITYDGAVAGDGVYSFSTHNGDVELEFDSGVNAEVSISTVQGEFETDCPVRLNQTRSGGRQFEFRIGSGGAHIDLESFGGTIHLGTRDGCWGGSR